MNKCNNTVRIVIIVIVFLVLLEGDLRFFGAILRVCKICTAAPHLWFE